MKAHSFRRLLRVPQRALREFCYLSPVRQALTKSAIGRRLYPAWERTHPFDQQFGTDTSGFVPVDKLNPDPALQAQMYGYAGSQPSIIRQAIAAIGKVSDYSFLDAGCGKGRALLVASEFPFRSVAGIELSPMLTRIAAQNARTIAQRFPARAPITVQTGNVVDLRFPAGNLVLFMYNSLGSQILRLLVRKLQESIGSGATPHAFVIYYNPIYGEQFDESDAFRRWFAETIPYDANEIGFGPDESDTVVIWQSARNSVAAECKGADRNIVALQPGMRAGLADQVSRAG